MHEISGHNTSANIMHQVSLTRQNRPCSHTIKHLYLVDIFIGAIGDKNKNRQNMRLQNSVSN